MEAEEVLAGLDPEQREVAEAVRGPGLRAGRRGHRQDPGDHAPDRVRRAHRRRSSPQQVLAVTFTTRAAGEMRGRLRQLGAAGRAGADVPRRRAAAAALLLAAGRRRRAAPAGRVQARPGRRGGRAPAGCRSAARSCATSPPRSSGPRSPRPGPRTTRRARGQGRRARRRLDAADVARVYAAYEELKPRARPARLRGRAAAHRRRSSPSTSDVADAGPRPVPPLRRRRVPGRQPAAAAAARPLARRARRPVRRRRPEPDDLLLHRRHPDLPARLPATLPGRDGGPAGPRLPLDAAGRRSWPTGCWRGAGRRRRARHRLELRRAAAPRPRAGLRRVRRRAGRGRRRGRARSASCVDAGVPASEIAVLFRINAQSEPYEQALADAGVPYVAARRRAVLRAAGGAPGVVLLRGAARAGGDDEPTWR